MTTNIVLFDRALTLTDSAAPGPDDHTTTTGERLAALLIADHKGRAVPAPFPWPLSALHDDRWLP